MKNYFLFLLALLFISTQYSCKKDTADVPFCRVTFWGFGTETFAYTYDDAGFVKRNTLSNGNCFEYTQTGNLLVRQSYNSSGVPTGTGVTYQVNGSGNITVMPSGSDTVYMSYNSAQQLAEYTRRHDTILSRIEFTYQDGDLQTAIEYRNDSTIKNTSTFEFYTNRENHTNVNISFDLLDVRMGKPCKHFVKKVTQSNSGNLYSNNFYYTFDSNGNPTALQVVNQPGNTISNLNFTYSCN